MFRLRKTKVLLSLISACTILFCLVPVDIAHAEDCTYTDADGKKQANYKTLILPCPKVKDENGNLVPVKDGVSYLINLGKTILTGLVGVAAVVGIVYGAILYATAGGNTENTKKGLTIIKDTVIGIIAYAFMYVILNFVLPNGV